MTFGLYGYALGSSSGFRNWPIVGTVPPRVKYSKRNCMSIENAVRFRALADRDSRLQQTIADIQAEVREGKLLQLMQLASRLGLPFEMDEWDASFAPPPAGRRDRIAPACWWSRSTAAGVAYETTDDDGGC